MQPDRYSLSRRSYLALAGAGFGGLAGCTESDDAAGDGTTDASSETAPSTDRPITVTSTPTATEADAVTATDVDSNPDEGTPTATDTPTENEAVSAAVDTIAEFSFEGSWFDTHAHWMEAQFFGGEDFTIDDLVAAHRQFDVGASVLFVMPDIFDSDFDGTVGELARDDVDYLPFLGPGRSLQDVYARQEEIFYGMGELPFYRGTPQYGLSFEDDPIPTIREFVVANDLPWMIHPTMDQAEGLNDTLADNPDLDVLLHGHELTGTQVLLDMLETYDNCYFTFDLGAQIGPPWTSPSSAAEFIDQFEGEWDSNLAKHSADLEPMLDVAPERVMWGTDIVVDWHVDPAFWDTIIDYSEDLLAELPADHRDPYAYENAVALFGG